MVGPLQLLLSLPQWFTSLPSWYGAALVFGTNISMFTLIVINLRDVAQRTCWQRDEDAVERAWQRSRAA